MEHLLRSAEKKLSEKSLTEKSVCIYLLTVYLIIVSLKKINVFKYFFNLFCVYEKMHVNMLYSYYQLAGGALGYPYLIF